MSEKINLLKTIEQDVQWLTPEQQKKANDILELLKKRKLEKLQVNIETRQKILDILKEDTFSEEISFELIEWIISWEISSDYLENLPQESSDKVWEDLYKELERQWWDQAYIFAKMLSLWYIPKFHDTKYQKEFFWNKIKWVWNNSKYLILWWPLTNWTINTPFIETQEKVRNYFSQLFIWEEHQLRILLNSIKWVETTWDRAIIADRLEKLNNLKVAIESWDRNNIMNAAIEYSKISEFTWKIWDLINKFWLNSRSKKTKMSTVDSEIKNTTIEIEKIDTQINDIKKRAEEKLKELNDIASKNPEKVPELRSEIERIVWEMNKQIADLEWKWVTKLQKLNPKDLELLAVNSKWTNRMIQANWWIDRILSWKTWWIIWVWAIILLAKWVYDWTSKDGFSSETALNITDIWLWMIPIAWWIYDIWMAIKWTDLNWKEMQSSERLMRAWFWIIWLVPLVWTAIKWVAAWAKTTQKATKLTQTWELITQVWLITWKIAWVWALWYWWISTVTYLLP